MSIRLNKVTKECNVGLQTAVEFLQKKGFSDVEANPNTKISDEQYQMLVAEFKKDKGLRDDAAIISRKRQHKEKKATIALPEEKPVEIKTATEAKLGKGPKVVGRIDLDNLGARKSVAAPEKKDTPAPAGRGKGGGSRSGTGSETGGEASGRERKSRGAGTGTPAGKKQCDRYGNGRCVPSEPYGAGCSPAQGEGTYRFGGFEPVYPS